MNAHAHGSSRSLRSCDTAPTPMPAPCAGAARWAWWFRTWLTRIFSMSSGASRRGRLAAGYDVLLADTRYCPERLMANVRLMLGRRVAGLAVIVSEMSPAALDELAHSGIRTVVSGVDAAGPGVTNVRVDCSTGMRRMVEYLVALGHRRIAFVGHHAGLESIGERRRAFLESAPAVDSRTFVRLRRQPGGRPPVRSRSARVRLRSHRRRLRQRPHGDRRPLRISRAGIAGPRGYLRHRIR